MQKKKTAPRNALRSNSNHNSSVISPKIFLMILCGVALCVLAFYLQYNFYPNGIQLSASESIVVEIAPITSVHINEVMTSNQSALMDDKNGYPDWIELINESNQPADISGWILLDKPDRLMGFTFPQGSVLGARETVVVFASKDLQQILGSAFHAPFKLSASGDAVMLFNANKDIVESVNVPPLSANQVYMRDPETGGWSISSMYTPGLPNTPEEHLAFTSHSAVENSNLIITEVMADNISYIRDEDGEYCDWIEVHNRGSERINLLGYALSDDISKPGKWRFPDIWIESGEYLIVYASGKDRSAERGALHASFKLNAEAETVILSNTESRTLDRMSFDNLRPDTSASLQRDGSWSQTMPPTPGHPNTTDGVAAVDREYRAANAYKLYITEAMASAREAEASSSAFDWMELYNASDSAIDLSGMGLSDDPTHPRKWQFPSGSRIAVGAYLKLALTGTDGGDVEKMQLYTNFKLSVSEGCELTLSTPDGTIIDRMPLLNQRGSVSFGRPQNADGFFYLETPTPGSANDQRMYAGLVGDVTIKQPGGQFQGGSVIVEMSAPMGSVIYYTTDCTEPTQASNRYEGPLQISSTTILRARAYEEGKLPSMINTQSYLFIDKHTMPVISLVTAPDNLFSEKRGIYIKGPNATPSYPYGSTGVGANFWMPWERAANIELFGLDGVTELSQGVGIALHGAYSRALSQKAFSVTARSVYGQNRFYSKLFPNRDYEVYKSFVLRGSGQDGAKTRMRDSLLTAMMAGTSVMYQDTRLCVVYLNGEYWGHYNMRERVNKYSIAQFEGWEDVDAIDLVKANDSVMQGSNESFAQMLSWLKQNGCATDENLARVAEVVDIDNYLDYIALQMFTGNTDTLNIKRYRNAKEGDGKWRWILFDLDWAMVVDTNSFVRWLNPAGMGNGMRTNNTLFVELMKNPGIREKFMHRLGELMATNFDSERLLASIDERYEALLPEMPAHVQKWSKTMSEWEKELKELRSYVRARPKKLLGYIKDATGMSVEEMRVYFGDVMEKQGL